MDIPFRFLRRPLSYEQKVTLKKQLQGNILTLTQKQSKLENLQKNGTYLGGAL